MSFDISGRGYSRSALFGAETVFLLELDYAGTIWRWSSRPIVVVDADGADVVFDGGLEDQQFDETLAIVSSSADDRSASFDVMWPGTDGVALLIGRGHDLAAAFGELSILVVGETFETRMIVVSGRVSQPQYGGVDEPVAFSLVEQPYDDTAMLIPPSMVITEETWPDCPDSSKNQRYPLPFTGERQFDATPKRPLTPAYALDDDGAGNASTLIVAGGLLASVDVSLVIYVDGVGAFITEAPVTRTADELGQRVSVVDISAQTATWRQAGAWWVYSYEPNVPGGATQWGGRAIATAGQLMAYLASRASVRTDAAAFASIAGALDWPIACYVDDDASPLGYLTDQLLPILPVSLASGPNGLYPVLWRYDARREEAVETITAGAGVSRVGRVEYESKPETLVQRIELDYGYNAANRMFGEKMVLEPPSLIADPRSVSDVFIRRAASRYAGDNPDDYRTMRVESVLIQSEATAARVVHWLARKHCYSPRLVEYDVGQEYGWLTLGAVVLVVDSEISLDAVALVVGRVISDSGMWRLKLQILDDALSGDSVEPSLAQTDYPSWPGSN